MKRKFIALIQIISAISCLRLLSDSDKVSIAESPRILQLKNFKLHLEKNYLSHHPLVLGEFYPATIKTTLIKCVDTDDAICMAKVIVSILNNRLGRENFKPEEIFSEFQLPLESDGNGIGEVSKPSLLHYILLSLWNDKNNLEKETLIPSRNKETMIEWLLYVIPHINSIYFLNPCARNNTELHLPFPSDMLSLLLHPNFHYWPYLYNHYPRHSNLKENGEYHEYQGNVNEEQLRKVKKYSVQYVPAVEVRMIQNFFNTISYTKGVKTKFDETVKERNFLDALKDIKELSCYNGIYGQNFSHYPSSHVLDLIKENKQTQLYCVIGQIINSLANQHQQVNASTPEDVIFNILELQASVDYPLTQGVKSHSTSAFLEVAMALDAQIRRMEHSKMSMKERISQWRETFAHEMENPPQLEKPSTREYKELNTYKATSIKCYPNMGKKCTEIFKLSKEQQKERKCHFFFDMYDKLLPGHAPTNKNEAELQEPSVSNIENTSKEDEHFKTKSSDGSKNNTPLLSLDTNVPLLTEGALSEYLNDTAASTNESQTSDLPSPDSEVEEQAQSGQGHLDTNPVLSLISEIQNTEEREYSDTENQIVDNGKEQPIEEKGEGKEDNSERMKVSLKKLLSRNPESNGTDFNAKKIKFKADIQRLILPSYHMFITLLALMSDLNHRYDKKLTALDFLLLGEEMKEDSDVPLVESFTIVDDCHNLYTNSSGRDRYDKLGSMMSPMDYMRFYLAGLLIGYGGLSASKFVEENANIICWGVILANEDYRHFFHSTDLTTLANILEKIPIREK